jgi:hypothetical protein
LPPHAATSHADASHHAARVHVIVTLSVRNYDVGPWGFAVSIASSLARAERIGVDIAARIAFAGTRALAVAVGATGIVRGRAGIGSGIGPGCPGGAALAVGAAVAGRASLRFGASLSCLATHAGAALAAAPAASGRRTRTAADTGSPLLQGRFGLRIERARHDRGDDRDGGEEAGSIECEHDVTP